jgi:hypothetical protein
MSKYIDKDIIAVLILFITILLYRYDKLAENHTMAFDRSQPGNLLSINVFADNILNLLVMFK